MLKVEDLTVILRDSFREQTVVENVSFDLKTGEALGIVGESGSGKTITALSLLQLLPPGMHTGGGRILLQTPEDPIAERSGNAGNRHSLPGTIGSDLAGFTEKQMQAVRGKEISMIFQEPMTSLNPSMPCGEQIREAVKLHGNGPASGVRKTVYSLLKEVHLPGEAEFYRKYPHQLSGGQRQRIMIAMALAGNPRILIADEPTTALDVTVQRKILDLLKEIRLKRGMGLLFISHDLGVIREVCENVLVMYRGRVVESGTVAGIFSRPGHPYTRGLIACRPVPGSSPHRLPTLADFTGDEDPSGNTLGRDAETLSGKHLQDHSAPGVSRTRENDPPLAEAPLLEVKDLRVEYTLKKNLLGKPVRKLRAVDRFSFRIYPVETVGLVGESGCGKSTLGRSLIRLIRAGGGQILYRGTEIGSLRGKDLSRFRQKVQFIFQDPYSSLNPRMAAGPAIMEVMKVHGLHGGKRSREKATLGLLDRVGLLPEHFGRYPHEFSGGQRQRIGLARALATGPELILCDESVSSLDVSVQATILNLLNDLKESYGLTYLFISHDLSVVRYMSDRILVMRDGMLVEEGEGERIFRQPATDYTRELVASVL